MAQLLQNLVQVYFDADGAPLTGGKLYSYLAGTTTPAATYTDNSGDTPNTNPVILDANGQANVWIGSGSYKFVLTDPDDVVQWTRDNVATIDNGSITTIKLADGSVTTPKINDGAVTTPKIPDNAITTPKILDANVTTPKINDGAVTLAKLSASTEIAFVDVSGPRFGDGASAFPRVPWTAPTLIAAPDSPALGDGLAVAWSPNGKVLAIGQNDTGFIALFARFGSELVILSPGIKDPALGAGTCVAWSPDGEYLLTAGSLFTSNIYQRHGNAYRQIDNPAASVAGDVGGVAFCPNGRYFAVAHAVSPYISIVKLTDVSPNYCAVEYQSDAGQTITDNTTTIINFEDVILDNMSAVTIGSSWSFTSKRSNTYHVKAYGQFNNSASGTNATTVKLTMYRDGSLSRTLASIPVAASQTVKNVGAGGSCAINLVSGETLNIKIFQNAGGTSAALAADGSAVYVSITEAGGYDRLDKLSLLSDPSDLPAGTGKSVAWSPDGLFLAVGHATSPYVTIYERTGDTFAKCADPAALPTGQVNGLSWSPDGLKLTCVHETTPFITTYLRSSVTSTTFVKQTAPSDLPAGNANSCAYNSSGDLLAVAHDDSPYILIYAVDGVTFTKLDDPSLLPAGDGLSVSWTPDSRFLTVGHVSDPYMSTYETNGTIGSDAVTFVKEVNLV